MISAGVVGAFCVMRPPVSLSQRAASHTRYGHRPVSQLPPPNYLRTTLLVLQCAETLRRERERAEQSDRPAHREDGKKTDQQFRRAHDGIAIFHFFAKRSAPFSSVSREYECGYRSRELA